MPHKIAVLVFLRDRTGRHLLLHRLKAPNLGFWSPLGGKLDAGRGESPFECAVRETREEAQLTITTRDLHLFAMISEQSYENTAHWLLFLFQCSVPVEQLPPTFAEGSFGLFSRGEIDALDLPPADRRILWPLYHQHRGDFVALKAELSDYEDPRIHIEQIMVAKTHAP